MRCIDHKKHSVYTLTFPQKFLSQYTGLKHSINPSCTLTLPWHNNASAHAYSPLEVTEKKTIFFQKEACDRRQTDWCFDYGYARVLKRFFDGRGGVKRVVEIKHKHAMRT